MSILVSLPWIEYVIVYAALRRKGYEWRAAAMVAATLWGVGVAVITEVLSSFKGLTVAGLTAAWLLLITASAWYLYRVTRRPQRAEKIPGRWRQTASQWHAANITLVLVVSLMIGLVGVTAMAYPPNTTDVMTYHMPRIVHWLHNHSVAFYPTNNLRQLSLQPWAEYAMLHLHALSGDDRFDNLVQWFSMIGSVIGVSLLAKMMGAAPAGQVLAALICATIPEGVLEASGAKNDYGLSFWLVCLVYYLLAWRQKRTLGNALGMGAALGLAWLTKGSAFVLAPPLIVAVALLWPWDEWKVYSRYLMLAGALAVVLNAAFCIRNYRLFGSPLGPLSYAPPNGLKLTNDRFGIAATTVNVMRNVALHADTSSSAVRQRIEVAVRGVSGFLGIDINDPRLTWDGVEFHVVESFQHEALAGNPLHCLLVLATMIILCWRWSAAELRAPVALAAGLMAAFVVFCALFKWQPWNTRLHLPLFVVGAAVAGLVLARSWPRLVTHALAILLLYMVMPAVFENKIRPLFYAGRRVHQSRLDAYFNERADLKASYVAAVQHARAQQCNNIGLKMTINGFEYPLLVLLDDQEGTRQIQDVDIGNESKMYATGEKHSPPCLVLCPECADHVPAWNEYKARFVWVKEFSGITVLGTQEQKVLEECSVSFTGWHGQERSGQDWWRWSSGKGKVHIFVSPDRDVVMTGGLSSIEPPNKVEVLFNGASKAHVETSSLAPVMLPALSLHLLSGDNVVEFVSEKPGIRISSDSRVLAIAIRNLEIRAAKGRGCPIR
jgi:hypothetical protein